MLPGMHEVILHLGSGGQRFPRHVNYNFNVELTTTGPAAAYANITEEFHNIEDYGVKGSK